MDLGLREESYDIVEKEGWSFTSKALLLSNVLVSILIVVVMSFIFFSSGSDVVLDSGNGGIQANIEGEFASEKPSSPVNGNSNNGRSASREDKPVNNNEEAPDDIVEDPEEVIEDPIEIDDNFDPQVLQVVEGCLNQEVTGQQCDDTFVRPDIIDYCDESETLYDRCYVMAALMNREIEYCDFVEGDVLGSRCLEALGG